MSEGGARATASGVLYVVATPIGNLEDLGARAARLLAEVELILAEDTRHTRRLLERHAVTTPVSALHEHNEQRRVPALVERIAGGARIALVSDAGTPLISDPGFRLVRAARERALEVIAVPGPCAAIAALSVAGLPTDRFAFEGFLPARGAERTRRLRRIAREEGTVVLYEAPHRIVATLADLAAAAGEEREAALARELTKVHEEVLRGSLAELRDTLRERSERVRGELVLVLAGCGERVEAGAGIDAGAVLAALLDELPVRRAVALAARITGERRNRLYRMAVAGGEGGGAGADL